MFSPLPAILLPYHLYYCEGISLLDGEEDLSELVIECDAQADEGGCGERLGQGQGHREW